MLVDVSAAEPPPNPCHLAVQKWTEKARYVKDCTLSSAKAFRNKQNLMVVSQLPSSSAAAGKAGAAGSWWLLPMGRHSQRQHKTQQWEACPNLGHNCRAFQGLHTTEVIQPSSLLVPLNSAPAMPAAWLLSQCWCSGHKPTLRPPPASNHRALLVPVLKQLQNSDYRIPQSRKPRPVPTPKHFTRRVTSLACTRELLNIHLQTESHSFHTASKTFTNLCHFQEVYKICN